METTDVTTEERIDTDDQYGPFGEPDTKTLAGAVDLALAPDHAVLGVDALGATHHWDTQSNTVHVVAARAHLQPRPPGAGSERVRAVRRGSPRVGKAMNESYVRVYGTTCDGCGTIIRRIEGTPALCTGCLDAERATGRQ